MLTDEQRNELKTLILEYGIAAVMESSESRPRQINRIIDFVSGIAASAAPAERRETADEKFNPYVEPEATTNQTLTEAIEWCIAHGNCGPRTRATLIAARSALATAPTMPHEGREPTGDELRKLVREIRDASGGPSDAPQPADYVLGGWRAALATAPTKPVEERDDWLDDIRRAIRVYACACSGDKSSIPNASREVERLLARAAAPTMSEAARARRFRHVKTGCQYRIICEGGMESDCTRVVVYQSEDAPYGIWVRPHAEFFDGRFAEIDRAAAKGGSDA